MITAMMSVLLVLGSTVGGSPCVHAKVRGGMLRLRGRESGSPGADRAAAILPGLDGTPEGGAGPCGDSTGRAIRRPRTPWRRPFCTMTAAWSGRRPPSRWRRCALPADRSRGGGPGGEMRLQPAHAGLGEEGAPSDRQVMRGRLLDLRTGRAADGSGSRVRCRMLFPSSRADVSLPLDSSVEPLPPDDAGSAGQSRRAFSVHPGVAAAAAFSHSPSVCHRRISGSGPQPGPGSHRSSSARESVAAAAR